MPRLNYGKYKGIIISIALFLILDASVLILNFYMSYEIADDAVGVNLAGRQRMLSQRMVKSLFELEHETQSRTLSSQPAIDRTEEELALTLSLFDQTINAFVDSGTVRGASGETVYLQAADSPQARAALQRALAIWSPYRDQINGVLQELKGDGPVLAIPALPGAIAYARKHNLSLLALMNDLTNELERIAASKSTRLRMIQTVGISLAVLNFFIIMFHFMAQLRDSDRKIEAARRETTDILETVNEGLFLLDHDMNIGSQHSRHLGDMLGTQELASQSFTQVLKDKVNEHDLVTAEKFIRLLFDGRIKEKLIGDLNPLSEVTVHIPLEGGGHVTKHLSFNFSRVVFSGGTPDTQLQHILVTVNDVTERVQLARELEASKVRGEQQLEMLTSILHVNPQLLRGFITAAFDAFHRINGLLKQPAKEAHHLRAKVQSLFVEVHRFKGEAAALNLDAFEDEAQVFEQEVAQLRSQPDLAGNDFLKLTVRLNRLIDYTQSIQQLADKLADFSRAVGPGQAKGTTPPDWHHLHDLTRKVAERQGKDVVLVTSGLAEHALPETTRRLVNDVCIQFIRNAVVHGIESPEARALSQKPVRGRVDVRLAELASGELELTVMDDGQGFNYDAIRARALASGRWTEEQVESWDRKRLLSVIFEPGFSTVDTADADAGHGVGMDVIKHQVQAGRGRISLSSRAGRYCRFVVTLPVQPAQPALSAPVSACAVA